MVPEGINSNLQLGGQPSIGKRGAIDMKYHCRLDLEDPLQGLEASAFKAELRI